MDDQIKPQQIWHPRNGGDFSVRVLKIEGDMVTYLPSFKVESNTRTTDEFRYLYFNPNTILDIDYDS